ncbi:MAG TPA: hypothetical protein VHY10_16345 [Xanthobacteraceae bacterium]|jgi:hypothetical protein|nr:hypothetical protein [Xanthobacteraceae bacterium]
MSKKKSRFKKPKPKTKPPAKDKQQQQNAADQAAVEQALSGAGDPGNAGAAAADPNAAGSALPPANAPMTNTARMAGRYGAGS